MPKKTREVQNRGYSVRKVANRELRQIFLIICEGEKTEPNYFKSFRVPKDVIDVDVRGFGYNPSKLVEKAKELNNQGDYDQIWCVFDRDDCPKQDFKNAIKNAHKAGFKVAYSNEAFELWYVLHFEFLNTGLPRQDYIPKLNKFLKNKYKKNSAAIHEELEELQPIAIKNAKKLLNQYNPPNPESDNPCTTVHELVEELNKYIP
ncbi:MULTISPECIES: RloB family protein [unclassified Nodularia (in: cyanobacteria)]|uniref:RloB family protein n=1 Tax=unclassified Nodularia (in: cyanobacteria) TaxID=2656917 RepID=UPI00187F88BF|nr:MULTISPECIES: RloB family protein [unclassified Nodularia (in: cyanobacteria)]MBE9198710.1 RloB domain-containing protein [Nodularia sp. LEGE 06071]MCC2694574.1 RloB domain-containing protein [Nodularia sp. LEGE 04288]